MAPLFEGKITITKDTQPDSAQSFGFTTTGAGLSPFNLSDPTTASEEFSGLPAATYTITETDVDGWDLDNISCTAPVTTTVTIGIGVTFDADFDTGDDTVKIVLGEDDEVECTFVNDERLGSITIVKDTDPDEDEDFSFTTTGTGLSNFSLNDEENILNVDDRKTFSHLVAGVFTIEETVVSGYDLSSINCGAALGIEFGDGVTFHAARLSMATLLCGSR